MIRLQVSEYSLNTRVNQADPNSPLDLGKVAALFAKWPGPSMMAAGVILACAAAGIRIDGVSFSGRDFVGFEFAAVFLGGILLVAIGTAVLLVRDRLLIEDSMRLRQQSHQLAIETARAAASAGAQAQTTFSQTYDAALKP
jgi:hypothetical protein